MTDLLAARRALDLQALLEELGAKPSAEELENADARALLLLARQDVLDCHDPTRAAALGSVLAELTALAGDLNTHA